MIESVPLIPLKNYDLRLLQPAGERPNQNIVIDGYHNISIFFMYIN